ncbi:MAG: 3-phosphoshikimate 1-carboxyvinyltransferase, partial [Rhodospirillales bacterium]|nr:3-phosphoshikimate 1-carboxyvinyltransferase [Rhodospirillales bacterium]
MPDRLQIQPVESFDLSLRVPGSKSLTNRALLLAALAEGKSALSGVLFSDDTRVMLAALQTLGFNLDIDEAAQRVTVQGGGGTIPRGGCELFLGNAGTTYRFLTAACCLGPGEAGHRLDGVPRMHQRPIGQLVDPLREIGAGIAYATQVGYPPLLITRAGLTGGQLTLQPTLSSQYISALLQVGPLCANGLTLNFEGPITSRPYVEMTVQLMRRFGADVTFDSDEQVTVKRGGYVGQSYDVEPDASNASYFLAGAAIVPDSRCRIEGLSRESLQGDVRFAEVLEQMGADVVWHDDAITVTAPSGGAPLHGVDVDLNDMPDMAQTLAAVAVFSDGPTTIRNVGNLRIKETDRMAAIQQEMMRLGVRVMIRDDDLIVQPPENGAIQP